MAKVSMFTLKKMGAIPKAKSIAEGQTVNLVRVFGVAENVITKIDSNGQETELLIGRFEVQRGDVTETSGKLMLPPSIGGALVKRVKTRSEDEVGVEFATTISAQWTKDNASGYVLIAKADIVPGGVDLLAELREALRQSDAERPQDEAVSKPTTTKAKGK